MHERFNIQIEVQEGLEQFQPQYLRCMQSNLILPDLMSYQLRSTLTMQIKCGW